MISGSDLLGSGKGLAALPVPVSTPGFDAAPYLTATLCITRDPDTGIQNMGTYRAALKSTNRLGVRMASRIGGAGGYLHWRKHKERKIPATAVSPRWMKKNNARSPAKAEKLHIRREPRTSGPGRKLAKLVARADAWPIDMCIRSSSNEGGRPP